MSENKFRKILQSRFFIAAVAGALCSLAFAPFYLIIFAPISLSIFFFLLDKENKYPFWLGLAYGFGYFLSGTYWITISLTIDIANFGWLIPFSLTLIPLALGSYLALLAVGYKKITHYFNLHKNYKKILLFAILWIVLEALRSHLFTGFPWNLLGYIWLVNEIFAQGANLGGIYYLSFLAILFSLTPILFLKSHNKKDDKIFAVIIAILFLLNLLYGRFYLNEEKLVIDHENKIRLVQSNIKQEMKWDSEKKYQNFIKTINLTNSKNLDEIKLVIWSETAIPYAIDNNAELMAKLKTATPPQGLLLSGALRFNVENHEIKNAWNSVFIFNQNGVANFYDKYHLVPFGEYIPFEKFLPFLNKITDGAIGFSKGEGAKTMDADSFKINPLICYEAIFFDKIIDKDNRPNLIVNVTNDAWFGNSSGPYQHFDMVRMRAIEHGISLARVANTGITAFIDPFGRVVNQINLNQEGIIDVDFIQALPSTIFEKYGHLPLISLILLTLIILFIL